MSHAKYHFGFWAILGALVLLFQYAVPIASDEAYFIAWGGGLFPGYYDHPPLPGWISYGLQGLENAIGLGWHGAVHRLFSIALGLIGFWLIVRRASRIGLVMRKEVFVLAMAGVPGILILFNMYLNDTLVAFFVLLFVLAVEAAYRAKRNVWLAILLAGLAFDLVLLTKYSGAVFYLGFILGFLSWPAGRRFLFGRFVAISLVALGPFLLQLFWNYQNCSVNLAFNFGFRSIHATGFGPLWVLLTLLVMTGPLGFVLLGKILTGRAERVGFFSRVFMGSVAVMFAVSVLRGEFGVNWGAPLGFLALLSLVEIAPRVEPVWTRRLGLGLSLVTLLPLTLVLAGLKTGLVDPVTLVGPDRAPMVRQHLDMADGTLPDQLRPILGKRVLVALEYGIGAGFENAGFTPVTVFSRSVFGRHQDLWTDFRDLNGRDMVIVPNGAMSDPGAFDALFDSTEILYVETARQGYDLVIGYGFKYETYRETWILPTITELYDVSPFPYGKCYMDRYR